MFRLIVSQNPVGMRDSSSQSSSEFLAFVPETKVAEFPDTSDEDDSTPTSHPLNANVNSNAEASSSKRKLHGNSNGGTPNNRFARDKGSDEARRRRKEVADRLWETRQELPFYRGELIS